MDFRQLSALLPQVYLIAGFPRFRTHGVKTTRHAHPFFELGVVILGQCDWYAGDGRKISLKTGEAILLSPNEEHHEDKESNNPTQVMFVGFNPPEREQASFLSGLLLRRLVLGEQFPCVQEILQTLMSETAQKKEGFAERIQLKCADLILLLKRVELTVKLQNTDNKKVGGRNDLSLDSAADYLDQNCRETLKIEQVARYFSLTPSHFTLIFRHRFGQTPKQYLLQKRFKQSKVLLREGMLSVKEVATQSGFSSSQRFCKWFREKTGMTPLQYRRQ
ncbi:MAG: AraC family transcriptional regulator [Verrucomicrobiota bacterium]|nr:AraC family transcriptional regulator [Verrucomicrobiota bacterium]